MNVLIGVILGVLAWFILRVLLLGFYVVNQNERAVKTVFERAQRIKNKSTLNEPIADHFVENEQERYFYPQVKVIQPGGPYFKWPWEKVYKVSIATETVNMAYDPQDPKVNHDNTMLEAVTKDQLNIRLTGQIRYRVSERNLYAYVFGVKKPIAHVMGYFVSILRERIANFEAPNTSEHNLDDMPSSIAQGISINDLRKNLRVLNDHMDRECQMSAARYGILLEASLITGIDPPIEVESALAAINTAHNHVSSDISLAQAAADQKIVQSKRAVEIETLNAKAEVEKLERLAEQLTDLKARGGKEALDLYFRNVRLSLINQTKRIIKEEKL